ncbi:GNAT family N-acetyltransferase [Brevibacillus choshinensis]|uniref:Uncharacterized protein n=1 Tax=Brevibacillus choshinensis TaxID=54911 RepID=A0ABX7FIE9_BRECH|nr:hypothetical protein JNE38_18765 [Brevibacillus choshinensis]
MLDGLTILRQVKKWAFADRNAHRLWLDVKETKKCALQLYLSEGFCMEGTLREGLRTGDEYESLIVLSMLRREYTGS